MPKSSIAGKTLLLFVFTLVVSLYAAYIAANVEKQQVRKTSILDADPQGHRIWEISKRIPILEDSQEQRPHGQQTAGETKPEPSEKSSARQLFTGPKTEWSWGEYIVITIGGAIFSGYLLRFSGTSVFPLNIAQLLCGVTFAGLTVAETNGFGLLGTPIFIGVICGDEIWRDARQKNIITDAMAAACRRMLIWLSMTVAIPLGYIFIFGAVAASIPTGSTYAFAFDYLVSDAVVIKVFLLSVAIALSGIGWELWRFVTTKQKGIGREQEGMAQEVPNYGEAIRVLFPQRSVSEAVATSEYCQACEAMVEANEGYCERCGSKVTEKPIVHEKKTCTNPDCQKENRLGASFCGHCGTQF